MGRDWTLSEARDNALRRLLGLTAVTCVMLDALRSGNAAFADAIGDEAAVFLESELSNAAENLRALSYGQPPRWHTTADADDIRAGLEVIADDARAAEAPEAPAADQRGRSASAHTLSPAARAEDREAAAFAAACAEAKPEG